MRNSFTLRERMKPLKIGLVGFNGNAEIPKKNSWKKNCMSILYIHVHTTDDDEKHCVEIIIFFR